MRAHHIMSEPVITVTPETPIVDAAKLMLRHHVGALPVIDRAGHLVGIVSDGDFIRRPEARAERRRGRWLGALLGHGSVAVDLAPGRLVGEIMTTSPVTVADDATLAEIVRTMEEHSLKRLPVINGDRLVGMVTYADLVETIADLADGAPKPTQDDDKLRSDIMAALDRRCRFNVTVRNGIANLSGAVRDDQQRQAALAATRSVTGVKDVHDHIWIYPPPEEDFGGGDFVSLQEEPSTDDDQPL